MHALTKFIHSCRQKYEVLVDENRQLRKDMQELETELFQVCIPYGCRQRLQVHKRLFRTQLPGLRALLQVWL